MSPRWVLVVALAGCTAAEAKPAKKAAVPRKTDKAATSWLRFSPHSSYVCARLLDGTFHVLGGPHQGIQLTEAATYAVRDLMCPIGGPTGLGANGEIEVGQFSARKRPPSRAGTVAEATSLARVGSATCWLDAAGALSCNEPTTYVFESKVAQALTELGPIAEMLPVTPHGLAHQEACARYRDGRVVCTTFADKVYLTKPLWTDAVQASVYRHENTFAGCAVRTNGTVRCVGPDYYGLSGDIAGLTDVDEVAVSAAHACARSKGRVWCWGRATGYESGDAARDKATPIKQCTTETTREAQLAAKCSPVAGELMMAKPTLVDGVEGVVAIGVRGGSSCALTAKRQVVCWGYEKPGLRVTPLP